MRIKQSKDQLNLHLKEQFSFLQKSAKEFDNGDLSEAKRMALHLRILLHDTGRQKSLLTSVGLKSQIKFLNTAYPYNPKNLVSHTGLVSINFSNDEKTSKEKFKALYGENVDSSYISFKNWWEAFVIVDKYKRKFKRKDIVLEVANTDGGAHVDENIRDEYFHLSRNNSTEWAVVTKYSDGRENIHYLEDIELFTVRQIAFEVTASIQKYFQ
jgi:hypothetical protein